MSRFSFSAIAALAILATAVPARAQQIPLPEHPRPDHLRAEWLNLNGPWAFAFDRANTGQAENWASTTARGFDRTITVPFPWGSPLSGVPDSADIGWYGRTVEIPSEWAGKRVYLVVGASDWTTNAWLDGTPLPVAAPVSPSGDLFAHRGGYTPFEFELTGSALPGARHRLVLRVDDTPHPFKLEGKQGYGPARGIWQTVYLEARGTTPIARVHVTPDPGASVTEVEVVLAEAAKKDVPITVFFPNGERPPATGMVLSGWASAAVRVDLEGFRWWSLDDPYLYEIDVRAGLDGPEADVVHTYFGMRTISVVDLPGSGDSAGPGGPSGSRTPPARYVALNGKPIYLQLALDQAYHPEGYYTFPTDEFLRDEVLRARQIGLNGMRVHVKIDLPRKAYWADKLGFLLMADVPNSWGRPDVEMRREAEFALRQMIARDYNHPSIFSWIVFNETWGLYTKDAAGESHYLPETQQWVEQMVALAKGLDPTRLVEDNSPCCGEGHTVTDLNTWHSYLPGYRWMEELARVSEGTFPGSSWNMEPGYVQGSQPNLNSEFGNVWGYEGSSGDVDWSWDYHRAINEFRRHPKVAGWLYTEHHDVINEWNGYWRYDRSEKFTGLEELAAGMSLRDLHSPLYISVGNSSDLSLGVASGAPVEVPLYGSFLAEESGTFSLEWTLGAWDGLGRYSDGLVSGSRAVEVRPWWTGELEPLRVVMPPGPAVALLTVRLRDAAGVVRHTNVQAFVVVAPAAAPGIAAPAAPGAVVLTQKAADISDSEWSVKQWTVLDGLKLNGAGSGYFEYRFPWTGASTDKGTGAAGAAGLAAARFVAELSAKQLFDKDREGVPDPSGDYMRGRGTHSPHRNPNAYPMTDVVRYPSAVRITVNGVDAGLYELPDDPADHRGILSWHAQPRDGKLREAGSYGYLVEAPVPPEAIQRAGMTGEFVVRLTVDEALPGGLAVYGAQFGRYPVDPSIVLVPR